MSREEMEAMRPYRCVCGEMFHTRFELEAHCECLPGVHEEAGPNEDTADIAQASPDAPGDAQAPVPDPMPEPAPAEAQSADESVGVSTRQYGTVSLPTPSVTFTAQLVPAQDYRMESIRAWATAAKALYANGSHIACAEGDDALDRIIELAGER